MSWTIENIDTLQEKIILVTGGNSGLGFESIKWFVSKDAHVVMATRSLERGETAKQEILDEFPNARIDLLELDLSDSASIKKSVDEYNKKYNKLDVLLNNAGVMTTPYGHTKDGLETQTGINHFGHFLFTYLLFDTIKNTPKSRIVNVSSVAHRFGHVNFKNLHYKKRYNKNTAYARSKLMNLLFTYELHRKVTEEGLDIKVLAAHPGVSKTNLGRHIQSKSSHKIIEKFQKHFSHPAKYGALPQVRASVDKDAQSGEFYGPNGFYNMKGNPELNKSTRKARNVKLAKRLWAESEKVWDINFKV